MAYTVLHDSERERAILFCTTSERPLDHEAFSGRDAAEQADNFLEWLACDPRTYSVAALNAKRQEWQHMAFDENDEYVGTV